MNDSAVAEFLAANPNFFADKDDLLMSMTITHDSGQAISLLERQVNILRERGDDRQRNIDSIIANAKANDELFEKIRSIILELLKTSSLEELTALINRQLKDDFAASVSELIFISDDLQENQTVLSPDTVKEVLGEMFDRKRSFCGSLLPNQARILFPSVDLGIVSAAIIPIHLPQTSKQDKPSLGMPLLVIGSHKENHFHSNLDTLFLDFIGEVLATHITRLQQ